MSKEKPKHGGARKGAGRKKTTGDSPRKQIRITPDLREAGLLSGEDVKQAALWAIEHGYKKEGSKDAN